MTDLCCRFGWRGFQGIVINAALGESKRSTYDPELFLELSSAEQLNTSSNLFEPRLDNPIRNLAAVGSDDGRRFGYEPKIWDISFRELMQFGRKKLCKFGWPVIL